MSLDTSNELPEVPNWLLPEDPNWLLSDDPNWLLPVKDWKLSWLLTDEMSFETRPVL